jgi:histidine triad (HIT) family protein
MRRYFEIGCEFCEIIQHQEPARIVYETEDILAFFPLQPATTGHTLMIPKWHISDFLSSDRATLEILSAASLKLGNAIESVVHPDGMNLITSAGKAASQTVPHLHLHLVPRWKGDPLGDIWPPKIEPSPSLQDSLAKRIRDACSSMD